MFKRTLLLITVICTGFVLFTTSAISLERSQENVITSTELQKMSGLRNKMIQSNFIEGQKTLTKIPSMLNATSQVSPSYFYRNQCLESIER